MPYDLIAAKLDEIEAEMRRIGYWFDNPPTPIPAAFDTTSAEMPRIEGWNAAVADHNGGVQVDAPHFVLYLQQVFLPWARQRVMACKLPGRKAAIGLLAVRHYDYHSANPVARPLVELLSQFDGLLQGLHGEPLSH